MKIILSAILSISLLAMSKANETNKPNVLFISIDDLNDWIGCLNGHPQTITPNLDRLAGSGQLFTNAHCVAPACNPSRSGVMLGMSPHNSGIYANGQKMREVYPNKTLLSKHFSNNGYWSGGSGKLLHYFIDAQSWDEYFPKKETEDPFPRTLYPKKRPVSLPVGGAWQYDETDWGGLPVSDSEYGGDYLVTDWVGKQLEKKHDKPFFLACGIYRPHEPWFVPQKYFDKFPLKDIQLPPGYKEDDLDDLPESGKKAGPNRYFKHIKSHNQWKQGVQGYLASIHYADTMLGRVLDSLEKGPNKANTIVVLWSDHGWHLGEKQHWQKFTAWRASTRVPLMIKVPKGCSAILPNGTHSGTIYDYPVSLLSLYNTLTELCGIPKQPVDSVSIVPTLINPDKQLNEVALTFMHKVGTVAVSGKDWRYIHYTNGDHELYNIKKDPYEWDNLATKPEHAIRIKSMRSHIPTKFAQFIPPSDEALKSLTYSKGEKFPASSFDGPSYQIVFMNKTVEPVTLFAVTKDKSLKKVALIGATKKHKLKAEAGSVWLIQSLTGKNLGHFKVLDRNAKAVIQ